MMNLFLKFLPVALFCMIACQNNQKPAVNPEYDKYYDSIMVIHDRTMPLTSKLENLREQLKKERKVALNQNAKKFLKINNLLSELNRADDAMFDWMNGFKPDSIPEDKKLNYIKSELSDVKHMEGLMLGGIGMAEAYFEDEKQN